MSRDQSSHAEGPALVTGGAGFIGSNLVRALRAEGRRVEVLDSVVHGRTDRVPGDVPLHRIDIRDTGAMDRVVDALAPATIFHLAAQVDVRVAVERPAEDADVNILGTIAVLEAARRTGAGVVFASSGGAAYGDGPDVPLPTPESHRPAPQSPYGLSKVCAEEYCAYYARVHGVRTAVLRLSNVYGPGQDHLGEGGVVAIMCGCAASGRTPTVFGDGLQTRDYVYVGDVVRAFLAAETAGTGSPLNIGTGVEVTVLDLLSGLGLEGRAVHAPE
ncbi:MAG: NAD-dependent epimerase/dehydratase family protein, partial [Miltoncostaeaceae bacterium]